MLAVHCRDERGAHGDFSLSVAGVPADETVHRLPRGKIGINGVNGGGLVGRLLVGECGIEGVASLATDIISEAWHHCALGLRFEKGGGEVGDGFLRVFLVLRPALSVQTV